MQVSLDQRFADAMGQLLGPDFPSDIGLAVSGGGDSMAMLTLAYNWAHRWGVRLWVATVDHGLRPESANEAAMVAEECRALTLPHATLRWHWDGRGNVMDQARRARLGLLNEWACSLNHILFAHTRDDVAERFLMRLARGAGANGLAAMQARRHVRPERVPGEIIGERPEQPPVINGGFHIIRPCLDMGRDELRHYLKTLKGRWVDDPTNDDAKYDRVRMRKLLSVLEAEGLGAEVLAKASQRQGDAKDALRKRALSVWDEIGGDEYRWGTLTLNREGLAKVERETQLRLVSAALQYVSTSEYGPRGEAVLALLERILAGGGGTLHGAEIRVGREKIRILREYNALEGQVGTVGVDHLWDGRWRVFAHDLRGQTIRALGDAGWQAVQDKPETAPPYHVARTLPAIWDGGKLMTCDALGVGKGVTTRLWPMGKEMFGFSRFLLSH
jgi:tRNA(Ile)-lysidine synthase